MDKIIQFQKKLIEDLGLASLPAEKQQELVAKMTEVFLKRVFVESMEKLNVEDKKIYSQMIEEKSSLDKIDEFLEEKIANYSQMVLDISQKFKEEMNQ